MCLLSAYHEKFFLGKIVLYVCIFVLHIMLSVCQKAHVTKIGQKIQKLPKLAKNGQNGQNHDLRWRDLANFDEF